MEVKRIGEMVILFRNHSVVGNIVLFLLSEEPSKNKLPTYNNKRLLWTFKQ